jgi:hypothetical protein
MNNEFSASKSANEREMKFARINSDAEIENCSFEEWMTEVRGKGFIFKETIGDWIVTLSFMGIGIGDDFLKTGRPGFWEVSEWNRRRRYGMAYDYGSEEDATESFFDSVVIGRKLGSAKEFLSRNIAIRPWICGNDHR